MELKNTKKDAKKFVNYLVYGKSSTGKTSLIKVFPENNTVIFSLENGLMSIADKSYDYYEISSIKDLLSLVAKKDLDKYENVAIDSLTELSQNHVALLKPKYDAIKKDTGKDQTMKMYGEVLSDLSGVFRKLRDLKKTVYATALFKVHEEKDGSLTNKPDIVGKSADRVVAWFDEVFLLYIDKDGNRKFLTEATERSMAKDRSTKLDKIEDADLGKIIKKITGNNNES